MKNFLIVEDDEPKLEQILSVVNSGFDGFKFSIARSLNSACKLVDDSAFDLAFLDMSLPTFDGGKTIGSSGRQRTLGGKDLLRYLIECEIIVPVFVITGFKDFPVDNKKLQLSELDRTLMHEFPSIYCGNVFFSHSSDEWKSRIRDIIKEYLC